MDESKGKMKKIDKINELEKRIESVLIEAYTIGKNDVSNITWKRDYLPELIQKINKLIISEVRSESVVSMDKTIVGDVETTKNRTCV